MTTALRHRGPDANDAWLDAGACVGLGHNRLAVIDLAGGAQPMVSFDERFVIVFNGEIYNFRALRYELEARGHRFTTNFDTEVILEAYRCWGRECLRHLRGMFAFALYDSRERLLFLARDRRGVKPLYYYDGPQGFFFASEIKAILACRSIPRRLNYHALVNFFRLGYPLLPGTLFEGIEELEAGTWLELSPAGSNRGRFREWKRPASWREDEALDRSESALLESLRDHVVSDVPIGAFLSGGIDSSLLVALSRRNSRFALTHSMCVLLSRSTSLEWLGAAGAFTCGYPLVLARGWGDQLDHHPSLPVEGCGIRAVRL